MNKETDLKTMPTVIFEGREFDCKQGANLRQVLLDAGCTPYNGLMQYANCRGLGTCGTCAVEISGPVSEPTKIESWRLSFPPHDPGSELRLSCQVSVDSDIEVTKHEGLWGHRRAPECKDESGTESGNVSGFDEDGGAGSES